jgi:hypothetical protein
MACSFFPLQYAGSYGMPSPGHAGPMTPMHAASPMHGHQRAHSDVLPQGFWASAGATPRSASAGFGEAVDGFVATLEDQVCSAVIWGLGFRVQKPYAVHGVESLARGDPSMSLPACVCVVCL